METAKKLWDSLNKKYKTEDAGIKKFIVGKFLDYKMVDSKFVYRDLTKIFRDLTGTSENQTSSQKSIRRQSKTHQQGFEGPFWVIRSQRL